MNDQAPDLNIASREDFELRGGELMSIRLRALDERRMRVSMTLARSAGQTPQLYGRVIEWHPENDFQNRARLGNMIDRLLDTARRELISG